MNSHVQSQQALAIARPSATYGAAHWLAPLGVHISRYALVLILFWIGIQKFTLAEAEGIRVFTMHSPFVSWMYSFLSVRAASSLIGTVEVSLAVLIALRPPSPVPRRTNPNSGLARAPRVPTGCAAAWGRAPRVRNAPVNSSSVPKPTIHPGQLWSPAMIVLVSAGFSSSFSG